MAENSLIAWTDHTFNPWMGCHKVSDGCKHCYAETLTKNRMGKPELWGATGKRQRTKQPWLNVRKWNRLAEDNKMPLKVFCASLADVFEDYPGPNEWRADVFELIKESPWLDFQLLTKRPENIARMLPDDWDSSVYPNVWLGTSIEDNRVVDRAPTLVDAAPGAVVHFVSYEPAIGPIDQIDLTDIEWLICGGESGPGYRDMDLAWAFEAQEMCEHHLVAFFFKQMSAPRTEMGIDALGGIYRDYPRSWVRPGQVNTEALGVRTIRSKPLLPPEEVVA